MRLFDQDPVAGIDQNPGHEVQRLLRSVHDEDTLRRAVDGPRPAQVGGQRPAQRRKALRRAIRERALRRAQQAAGGELAPDVERKALGLREAVAEVVSHAFRRTRRPWPELHRPPAVDGEPRRGAARGRGREGAGGAAEDFLRKFARDVGAGADLAPDVAFGEQLVVGEEYCVARNAAFRRDNARRGQPRPGRQLAGEDRLPKRAIDPLVKGSLAVEAEEHGIKWYYRKVAKVVPRWSRLSLYAWAHF